MNTQVQSESTLKIKCPVLPVKIKINGNSNCIETYAALDTCSTDCFLQEDLLKKLRIKTEDANIFLTTIGQPCEIKTRVINNLQIWDMELSQNITIPLVYTRGKLPFSKEDVPMYKDICKNAQLKNIPFKYINAEIGMLIGMNVPELLFPLETIPKYRELQPNDPYATLHKFGWALQGPTKGPPEDGKARCNRIVAEAEENMDEKLARFFDQDFKDSCDESLGPSIQDNLWQIRVKESLINLPNGHYEIALPFKEDCATFPPNRFQVLKRFESLKKKMINNENFSTEYKEFMKTMLNSGFIEKVPQEELANEAGDVWYLVHHGVYHKQKNKLRIVFDCSLKCHGVSLNDKLLQGPDLTNNLISVLLRFRQEPIAIMADIEKMFYQVTVPKKHRNYMRFFWYKNDDPNEEPIEYRIKVHVFGAVSSPAVANYALKQTAENKNYNDTTTDCVKNDFYVDDLLKSVPTEIEAISLIKETQSLLSTGGFNLTGFVSNSRSVLNSIPKNDLSKSLRELNIQQDKLPSDRALGVTWNLESDNLSFSTKLKEGPMTKRNILSNMFSIYDPLGLIAPALIPAKRIFQEACKLKLHWDDKFDESLSNRWQTWFNEITKLSTYEISRCYKPKGEIISQQIHLFSDGSEIAYGAVAYARFKTKEGEVKCTPIISKSRLTPVSNKILKTTPRIELNAARLSISIWQKLKEALELNDYNIYFWTDSRLQWF